MELAMKSTQTLIATAVIAALIAMPVFAGRGGNAGAGQAAASPLYQNVAYQEVDALEAATLSFMREEEKLARDVYLNLFDQWQSPLFENIANAEQRHMDAVKAMLDKYALEDPADADSLGSFANTELQNLYDALMASGAVSYLEALKVGALIEEVDIEDNELAIAATDNDDLTTLYANLLRGSRNHLRAFVAEIERQGVVYEAQYLSTAAVDEIVDSPMERGTQQGLGGNGNGAGRR
jgi:hypothetical protein